MRTPADKRVRTLAPQTLSHAKSRRALLGAGIALLGVPALASPARARVTLRFHTFMAPVSQVWQTMHLPWMARVEAASEGAIRFEAFPAMQLGGAPPQLISQVRDGVADLVWTLPGYTPGRFPRIEAFELPFAMTDAEASSRALWQFALQHAADEWREVQTLALHVHGPGVLHTASRPVKRVADLRGLKLRGPTRQATRLLAVLGATPVGLPLPQIPEALSRGTVDGAVIPWEVVPSVRVQELVRHHTEFAPGHPALYTATFVLAMNRERYAGLPAELRAVIDAHSGAETSAWLGRTQQANDATGRQAAVARGNSVHVVAAADAAEFRERAAVVDTEWVDDMDRRGLQGGTLLAAARQLAARPAGR